MKQVRPLASIKSVLVHLNPRANAKGVLEVALGLARRHRAQIAGLGMASEAAGDSGLAEQARILEHTFRTQAMQLQLLCESREIAGNEEAILILASRTHDVLVLGQADPNEGKSWPQSRNLLEGVLLKSGHPLIAVPYLGSFLSVGDRVLVAWSGAREAARALEDALPILEKAEQVTVLTVDLRSGDALSVDRLVGLLERHGVNVSTEGARSSGRSIGQTLLASVSRHGCDLLVMGGYGHSPIREHLFGGATYYVLEHMNVPVLLSH